MGVSKKTRELVFNKFAGKCAYCGCELTKGWQLDHLIPQIQLNIHGSNVKHEEVHCIENYMPACASCNNYKGGKSLDLFRKSLQKQPEILRRDRPTVRIAERFGLVKLIKKPVVFYFETLISE